MNELPPHYAPLSGWDEYPIHQTVAPVRYVATTDPRAFERYWFTATAKDGSLFMITGIGFYPNLGVVDGYCLVVHEGRQTVVRAHRKLTADRADLCVGPINFDPVAPFKQWNLGLQDNEHGFAFDLKFFDSKRPRFSKMDAARFPGAPENIHLLHDWGGYEGFGSVEGEIRLGGKTITLTRDRYVGSRDHHWGIRDGVGGMSLSQPKKGFSHCAQFVEFKDWGIWGPQVLLNPDNSASMPRFVETLKYELDFDPQTRQFREAIATNRLDNGEIRVVHYQAIPHMTGYLRCGGYAGPDGRGTPDSNYLHGKGIGDAFTGHVYDVTDVATQIDLAGFEDHLCFVTCGDETTVGVFECMNPAIHHMCEAGFPRFFFLDKGAHS